jgi:methionyl-tRNA formyltransferase
MARLAFLGSPEAAAVCLRSLAEANHEIVLVVSRTDKRRGRGPGLTPSPVKKTATELGLPVTDDLETVTRAAAELGIVVAYGRIIPKRVLDALPMLNAHFSLLPRWRGAAPVERAILAGDSVSGVSIMRLEEGLDTGPVLLAETVEIHNAEREHASALTERLAVVAAKLLVEVLAEGVAMLKPGKVQAGSVTYAAKIEPQELRLDFTQPVTYLERLVRLDRAWTIFRGERLGVLDAIAHEDDPLLTAASGAVPGTLHGTSVSGADGSLELLRVQPAGRRVLGAQEWARGAHLGSAERLGEPH